MARLIALIVHNSRSSDQSALRLESADRAQTFRHLCGQIAFMLSSLLSANAYGWDAYDPSVNPFPPTPEFAKHFQINQLEMTDSKSPMKLDSFVFIPNKVDLHKKYPLIIWLHGLGEIELKQPFGALNWLSELIFTDPEQMDRHDFFVFAPRCTNRQGWVGTGYLASAVHGKKSSEEPLAPLSQAIEELCDQYPVDKNRISVVGISAGAAGALHWSLVEPDRFAAIVLMSGGGELPAHGLGATPAPVYWQFVNRDDTDYPLDKALKLVSTINTAGGNAFLTVFPTGGHNVWNRAFSGKYQLIDWLLRNTRATPPTKFMPQGEYTVRLSESDLLDYEPPAGSLGYSDDWLNSLHELSYKAIGAGVLALVGWCVLLARKYARRHNALH
jgi:predicted esterase